MENAPGPIAQAGGVSSLQFDRLDFGDEPSGVVTQVRGNHVEHGVTEAADVQDVVSLGCLAGSVGLNVQAEADLLFWCLVGFRRVSLGLQSWGLGARPWTIRCPI